MQHHDKLVERTHVLWKATNTSIFGKGYSNVGILFIVYIDFLRQ